MKNKKKIIFGIILLLIIYIAIEGFCLLGLKIAQKYDIHYDPIILSLSPNKKSYLKSYLHIYKNKGSYFIEHHPLLGWTYRKNAGKNKKMYRSNSQRLRVGQENAAYVYTTKPPENKVRIAGFGNSFVYGSEVYNRDTWAEQLCRLKPGVQFLNFGVMGYGLGQAYLRYREEGRHFNPHIVIIGFLSDNIERNVSYYQGFIGWSAFNKPRFVVQNDRLTLIKPFLTTVKDYEYFLEHEQEVLRKLGLHDYHFHKKYKEGPCDGLPSVRFCKILKQTFNPPVKPIYQNGFYNTQSEAFSVTVKIFEQFYQEVLAHNALPLIILFPEKWDVQHYLQTGSAVYAPLLEIFKKQGLFYIDALKIFEQYKGACDIDDLFMGGGHFSPKGNGLLAKYLAEYLKTNGLDNLETIRNLIHKQKP